MDKKSILIFIGFFFVLTVIIMRISKSERRKNSNEYFKNLNLVLTGIVTDKQVLYSDAGMLFVDVRSSTIPEYDIRPNDSHYLTPDTPYYYCVIHKNKAEILEVGMAETHVGDSIVVNSIIDSVEFFRDNRLVVKRWLYISNYDRFYRDVRRLHRL